MMYEVQFSANAKLPTHFQEPASPLKLGFFCCFFVFFTPLSMNSGDSEYLSLAVDSGAAPGGPAELVLCWYSTVCGGCRSISFSSPPIF